MLRKIRNSFQSEKVNKLYLVFSSAATLLATLLVIFAFFSSSEKDLNSRLLAESIPSWLDIEVVGTVVGPNAFHPDIEVIESYQFSMQNPTNFPIRIGEIHVNNDRGQAEFEQHGFVVLARSFESVEVIAPIHRHTEICVTGTLQDGTYIREIRSLELSPPAKSDPMVLMGFAQFGVRVLDQKFAASPSRISC